MNKKYYIYFICFITIIITMFMPIKAFAHDIECGIWNGEEDALILGVVEKVEDDFCTISNIQGLPCVTDSTIYRMIPLESIPPSMIINMNGNDKYSISYNDKDKIEVHDNVIMSVDKVFGNWKINYAPYEVSSLNTETLEFLPQDKKTGMAAAWEAFVHSKGKIKDFFFDGDLVKAKYSDENGNVKDLLIFGQDKIINSEETLKDYNIENDQSADKEERENINNHKNIGSYWKIYGVLGGIFILVVVSLIWIKSLRK